jgi:hypothetical protein
MTQQRSRAGPAALGVRSRGAVGDFQVENRTERFFHQSGETPRHVTGTAATKGARRRPAGTAKSPGGGRGGHKGRSSEGSMTAKQETHRAQ